MEDTESCCFFSVPLCVLCGFPTTPEDNKKSLNLRSLFNDSYKINKCVFFVPLLSRNLHQEILN